MPAPKYLRPDLPSSYAFSVRELPTTSKLDQNEAPVDLPDELKAELSAELCRRPWNRYIQPQEYREAKEALAELEGVSADAVAITSGADQGLLAAAMVGGGPGRKIRWFEPTYPFIGHAAKISRGDCQPLTVGRDIDTSLTPEHIGEARLVYFVSPNNPTGGLVDPELVRRALNNPERLVVVDEAYHSFSRSTVANLLDDYPNLLVVRSLSKSLLASVHVGCVLGAPETIAIIERMLTAPYNLNAIQLLVCRRYGQIRPHVVGIAAMIRRERARMSEALERMDCIERVYPSEANFVLFEVAGDASKAARQLAEEGVRLRDVSSLAGLENHLRVTVGTREDNDVFLGALEGLEH